MRRARYVRPHIRCAAAISRRPLQHTLRAATQKALPRGERSVVCLLFELGEVLDRADHLAGVRILVIVPGDDLDERGTVAHGHTLGLRCIEQRAVGDADDVGGDDLLFGVAEGSGSGSLHGGVDFIRLHVALADGDELGERTGGNGNALCAAVQNAVELGNDEADRLCSARGVGDHVHGSGARTAQVALAVRSVEHHLVARVSVDGRHVALLDLAELVERVCHGSKAVGRAGSRGDDGVRGLQRLFIDAVHDGGQVVAGGSGDDDLLRACVDVRLRLRLGGVEARALQHDVDVERLPGKVDGVLFLIDLDGLAVHRDGALFIVRADGIRKSISALRGIVLQKVRKHRGAGEVIDRDDLIAGCIEHLTERKTADTAKSVDRNFHVCHLKKSSEHIFFSAFMAPLSIYYFTTLLRVCQRYFQKFFFFEFSR